jgi:hypothetical protein
MQVRRVVEKRGLGSLLAGNNGYLTTFGRKSFYNGYLRWKRKYLLEKIRFYDWLGFLRSILIDLSYKKSTLTICYKL